MVIKRINKIQLGECVKDAFYSSLDDYMWDSIDSIFTFDSTTLHDDWKISLTEAYPVMLIIQLIDEEYNMRTIIKLFMFNHDDESIFIAVGHQEIEYNKNEFEYLIIDDRDLSRILDDYIVVIKDYQEHFILERSLNNE